MKKIVVLILCLTLLLCACTGTGRNPNPTETRIETEATQPSEPVQTEPVEESTEPSQSGPEDDPLALAQSCVGQSVQALYACIGEPTSSDYAPSCLGPGEDGNLYYENYGFTVYTYRENGVETVRVVD